jgi:hypothetical protein
MVLGPVFMFCAPGLIFGGTEGADYRYLVLRSRNHFQRYRARRVSFSCFTLPNPFLAVPTAPGPVFIFCAPGLGFGGTEGVGFRFHVLRSRTRFQRYRRRLVPLSFFALPDSFSAVLRASCPVFMFCAPGLVFGGTDGVGSRFHVLRSRNHFQRYRGRRVPISYFALPDPFLTFTRALVPDFIFCAPVHVFGGTEGVVSRFKVLRY